MLRKLWQILCKQQIFVPAKWVAKAERAKQRQQNICSIFGAAFTLFASSWARPLYDGGVYFIASLLRYLCRNSIFSGRHLQLCFFLHFQLPIQWAQKRKNKWIKYGSNCMPELVPLMTYLHIPLAFVISWRTKVQCQLLIALSFCHFLYCDSFWMTWTDCLPSEVLRRIVK